MKKADARKRLLEIHRLYMEEKLSGPETILAQCEVSWSLGDGVAVWKAIEACQRGSLAFPVWLRYALGSMADEILKIRKPGKTLRQQVVSALHLDGNSIRKSQTVSEKFEIAQCIESKLREGYGPRRENGTRTKKSISRARGECAKEFGVSVSKVEKAWKSINSYPPYKDFQEEMNIP